MRHSFVAAALLMIFLRSEHWATANETNLATSLTASGIEQIDAIIADIVEHQGPGCAIAVERDGKVLYSQGYGHAQLEYMIPITADTIFHVASVSKQFTAFAIALLEADGKLVLDDDIQTYIPEVPDFGQRITLRHLIHHTSGMRDQWDLFALAGGRIDDVISESDIMELVARQCERKGASRRQTSLPECAHAASVSCSLSSIEFLSRGRDFNLLESQTALLF